MATNWDVGGRDSILLAKNNSSSEAICVEKVDLDEQLKNVRRLYVIIERNEVTHAYEVEGYGKLGYDAMITNRSDDFISVSYTPNLSNYLGNVIFPSWLIFTLIALFILWMLGIIGRNK